MSQITIEEKYIPHNESEFEYLDFKIFNNQEDTKGEYGENEFPNLKMLRESLKEGFSISNFTMNYALLINIPIIVSVIMTVWLLTIIGGIFNDFIIIAGIIAIVLILMMFESLSLIEKEINQKAEKGEDIQENENNLSNA